MIRRLYDRFIKLYCTLTMLKALSSREQEKEGNKNGDQLCCLLEDGEKCRRLAGNASFNFRVQKLVKQRKLGLTLDPEVSMEEVLPFIFFNTDDDLYIHCKV